ncbi:MAG TPA: hypothetical protein VGH09_10775 [Solirubrobacteraceae bacterium]
MHRVLLLVLLVPVVGLVSACGQAHKPGVRAGIEEIASISAESSLMADDLARGRTKTTYFRVHGAELSAQAQHEAQKLNDDPVAPELKPPIQAAITLASDIGGAIDEMRVSPQDRQQAREDQAKLHQWAVKARALAESL